MSRSRGWFFADLHHLLADVLAPEQPPESLRQALDAFGDVELGLEHAGVVPGDEPIARFRVARRVVAHEKTADRRSRDERLAVKPRTDIGLAEFPCKADRADEHDARVRREVLH